MTRPPPLSSLFPYTTLFRSSLAEFEEFFYGACLRDWDEESKAMHRLLERFDAAEEVRIVGAETDLTLSLRGRRDRKSTRLNSSHQIISYAVFCLKIKLIEQL